MNAIFKFMIGNHHSLESLEEGKSRRETNRKQYQQCTKMLLNSWVFSSDNFSKYLCWVGFCKNSFSLETYFWIAIKNKQNHCPYLKSIMALYGTLTDIYNIFIWEICFMWMLEVLANHEYVLHPKGKFIPHYHLIFVLKERGFSLDKFLVFQDKEIWILLWNLPMFYIGAI